MRNISSTVLSLAAMVLSSITTYLTFFDARYTVTFTIATAETQISRGSGYDGVKRNVNFRFYVDPLIVLSNRGTRAVVITEARLVKSASKESCVASDVTYTASSFSPIVMEPGTVSEHKLSLRLEDVYQNKTSGDEVTFDPVSDLWCLGWTVIDPNGGRHEPLNPAFTTDMTFETPEGEAMPEVDFGFDYVQAPQKLVARGF